MSDKPTSDDGRQERRPGRPDDWRDLLDTKYDYPDELLTEDLSRKQRRRGKKQWRKEDRAQRAAWIRDARRDQEPTSPAVILVAVVVLVLVVLGASYAVPKWFTGDNGEEGVTLLKPTEPAAGGITNRSPAPSPAPTKSPASTSSLAPTFTPTIPAQLTPSTAGDMLLDWTREFYTRRPAQETYTELVNRLSPYLTDGVAETLKEAGDPTYDALGDSGGASRVGEVAITYPPKNGGAPADTPTRVTRRVIAQIIISGREPARFDLRALVTVVPDRGTWRVSAIAGATG